MVHHFLLTIILVSLPQSLLSLSSLSRATKITNNVIKVEFSLQHFRVLPGAWRAEATLILHEHWLIDYNSPPISTFAQSDNSDKRDKIVQIIPFNVDNDFWPPIKLNCLNCFAFKFHAAPNFIGFIELNFNESSISRHIKISLDIPCAVKWQSNDRITECSIEYGSWTINQSNPVALDWDRKIYNNYQSEEDKNLFPDINIFRNIRKKKEFFGEIEILEFVIVIKN